MTCCNKIAATRTLTTTTKVEIMMNEQQVKEAVIEWALRHTDITEQELEKARVNVWTNFDRKPRADIKYSRTFKDNSDAKECK